MVPHGDRSDVVIEPFLTDQWYVNAKALAEPAIAAVREGKTQFVPKNWEKTYFDWMENIQPWCISRQLWWGHQIPAWYGPDGKVFVAETEDEAVARALAFYAETGVISTQQARDMAKHPEQARAISHARRGRARHLVLVGAVAVLDARLAGRDAGACKRYYPTTALVTGFDIIFFWVARMMMMGLHFMKEVPFKDVYIHALVRDEQRRQDVEVEGQRHRSARADRRLRRRRAALHAGGDGGAGPRHQAFDAARRGLPQLRDQALERRALRRVERRRARAGLRSDAAPRRRSTAGSRTRPRRPRARSPRRSRPTGSTRRRARPTASSGTSIATGMSNWRSRCSPAPTAPAKDETRATGGLGARRNPEAAAPVHAVHHRGAVARDGRCTGPAEAGTRERHASLPGPPGASGMADLLCSRWPCEGWTLPTPRPRSAGWSISSPRSARCAPR